MKAKTTRKLGSWGAMTALIGVAGVALPGCDEDLRNEFRSVAAPALAQGFGAIATGIIDGIFAIVEPDETSDAGG